MLEALIESIEDVSHKPPNMNRAINRYTLHRAASPIMCYAPTFSAEQPKYLITRGLGLFMVVHERLQKQLK